MKKIVLAACAFVVSVCGMAQTEAEAKAAEGVEDSVVATTTPEVKVVKETIRFGYLSYTEVMEAMPEYAQAMADIDSLKSVYDREVQQSSADLNKRFVEYVEGLKSFPENILLKRQKELQMLIDQSLEFKKGAQTVLDKAQKEIMQSVKVRLKEVIAKIGKDRKYAFILNTDNNACPFVDGEQGEDITSVALELVRVKK